MTDNCAKKHYMVRTHDEFKNSANIGWEKIDLSKDIAFEDIANDFERIYLKNIDSREAGKKKNQIRRFLNIKKGDVIIVPSYRNIKIGFAVKRFYEQRSYGNMLEVEFLRNKEGTVLEIPRTKLSEKIQTRLKTRGMTVADYQEFAFEIDDLIKNYLKNENFSPLDKCREMQNEKCEELKKELLKRIQNGETYLRSGGIGLECLIKELLEIEGYSNVKVFPKNTFPGKADADISAEKFDPIYGETKTFFQVKHHKGVSDEHGINQLIDIKQSGEYDFTDLVFITTAKIQDTAIDKAANQSITTLDGEQLVDWIYSRFGKLSDETKFSLGIISVPSLFK